VLERLALDRELPLGLRIIHDSISLQVAPADATGAARDSRAHTPSSNLRATRLAARHVAARAGIRGRAALARSLRLRFVSAPARGVQLQPEMRPLSPRAAGGYIRPRFREGGKMDHQSGAAGAAVYEPFVLRFYDWWVLGVSNRFAWECPTDRLVAHYDRHVSDNHLDVGVGTGFFLDRCRFPSTHPRLTLLDLNANSLRHAAARVARYTPSTIEADVLAPLGDVRGAPFDSIGLSYLVHCLPGPMERKEAAFANLAPLLAPGGVCFGATILGRSAPKPPLGRALERTYNRARVFGNGDDTIDNLRSALRRSFADVVIDTVGSVALFSARRR
jgi:SAM-dependent methyltransferase